MKPSRCLLRWFFVGLVACGPVQAATYDGRDEVLVLSIRTQCSIQVKDATTPPIKGKISLRRYYVTDAQIQACPAYRPEADIKPPLSGEAATQIAAKWLHERSPEAGNLSARSVKFERLPHARVGDLWYYLVDFNLSRIEGHEDSAVMVLLDGTVVEPRVTVTDP